MWRLNMSSIINFYMSFKYYPHYEVFVKPHPTSHSVYPHIIIYYFNFIILIVNFFCFSISIYLCINQVMYQLCGTFALKYKDFFNIYLFMYISSFKLQK